jgi:hypothetical protein
MSASMRGSLERWSLPVIHIYADAAKFFAEGTTIEFFIREVTHVESTLMKGYEQRRAARRYPSFAGRVDTQCDFLSIPH